MGEWMIYEWINRMDLWYVQEIEIDSWMNE